MSDLEHLVNEWLRLDRNPVTRAEIQALWDSRNISELERRLRKRIEFGTAGLRGRMEAGFSRMNDLIVIQASQGLCAYVLSQIPDAKWRGIVIGHDHRHHSEHWARLTAAAFIAEGFKVYLHRGLVHTPLVPFSVTGLRAACGVMITASHNPKHDNGYKVYWENGVQIIGPHDDGIAQSIQDHLEPRNWDAESVLGSPICFDKTSEMRQAYFDELAKLATPSLNNAAQVKFVNTSMHGVGHSFALQAFEIFGLPKFIPVKEQQNPDPEFPTVKFPNPEEKGALDIAIKTADEHDASYVLAQDPDADRFCAAERQEDKSWKIFSGDQLGTIFAAWVLHSYKDSGRPIDELGMVASTVSSKIVESMAEKEGFRFVESLTGFKYIGNAALDLQKDGFTVLFGYEEAIGFMLGSQIRDKDGISATAFFAQMIVSLRSQGRTAWAYLNELYEKYGYFETSNSYFICSEPTTIDRVFARLRNFTSSETASPSLECYPRSLSKLRITQVRDLTTGHGFDSTNAPSLHPILPLSSGHMITFRASGKEDGGPDVPQCELVLTIRYDSRVRSFPGADVSAQRTSGTEPKIKYYLEGSGKDREAVKRLLLEAVREIRDHWMEAEQNGLGEP